MKIKTIDLCDPSFDLEIPDFDGRKFSFRTPVNKINKDLEKFRNKFIIAHINSKILKYKYYFTRNNL